MSLLSFEFFALSVAAIAVSARPRSALREVAFVALSAWFAWTYMGLRGSSVTLAFCFSGWLAAHAVAARPRSLPLAVTILTVAFVYLRGYGFLDLLLPSGWATEDLATVGLSFLFFKVLHVVIDAGGGVLRAPSPLRHLAYCLNFTTLLLGPIQRFQDFDDQWEGRTEPLPRTFVAHLDAVNRVLRGLVKKFVVAEYVGDHVLRSGLHLATMPWIEILLATWIFYVFLYFDFSGYCDVVIGVGCLIGIRPPENFDFPFLAANVAEFWLRVHRSLTTWLTDYVFNPTFAGALRSRLLGTRPFLAMAVALMVTMFVSGLWHGTTLGFLLFGLVHGILLVVFRGWERLMTAHLGRARLKELRGLFVSRALATALTFVTTATTYAFFVLARDDLDILWGRIA